MSDISASAATAASSALGGASPGVGGITDAKKLHEVSQQFEAIFVRQMLAESRKTNLGDELFGGQGTDTFREMQEQTIAASTTKAGGLGFAKLIEKKLASQLHIGGTTATASSATTGAAYGSTPIAIGKKD
ncbi:rod-binding protein [Novosphingobium rosa]|uniref:rod-binding protein n=1 Tax=Novosphingobium rosa TaxID=76978 RepID=UPI00082B3817|nr:rod-binding protein [Novosphingobium rosa]